MIAAEPRTLMDDQDLHAMEQELRGLQLWMTPPSPQDLEERLHGLAERYPGWWVLVLAGDQAAQLQAFPTLQEARRQAERCSPHLRAWLGIARLWSGRAG